MFNWRLVVVTCLALACRAAAFAPPNHAASVRHQIRNGNAQYPVPLLAEQDDNEEGVVVSSAVTSLPPSAAAALARLASASMVALAPLSALAADDIEIADLPPPWIPAVFSVFLVVGVGVLTGSLGNVIDEGEQRGAAKEQGPKPLLPNRLEIVSISAYYTFSY